ncbi:hypothetical protein FB45DRAFT_895267 [Roridomyces roridus]|uniref:Uncharacterized protein n=1 Tax=Roridomyces roridus TaxID=1738132 RepID=A0AAD7G184_9AGAR|nr:hypothetical protein FB45DRAFT_895267 [Roridomyces roridus]
MSPSEFIPYLYFSPTPNPRPSATLPAGAWTHTLRLLPCTKSRPAGCSDLSTGDVHRRGLDLYLPSAAFKGSSTGDLASLTRNQLLIARDFLALALPYYASAHPSEHFSIGWPSQDSSASSSSSSGSSSSRSSLLSSRSSSSSFSPMTPESFSSFGMGLGGLCTGMAAQQTTGLPAPATLQADAVRVILQGPARLLLAIGVTYIAYASGCEVKQVVRGVLEEGSEWGALLAEEGNLGGKGGEGGFGFGREMAMLEEAAIQGL